MASKGSGGVQFTSLRCVADHWIGVPRAQILGEKMDVSSLVAVVICGDLMVIHHGIYRIYIYICIYIYDIWLVPSGNDSDSNWKMAIYDF